MFNNFTTVEVAVDTSNGVGKHPVASVGIQDVYGNNTFRHYNIIPTACYNCCAGLTSFIMNDNEGHRYECEEGTLNINGNQIIVHWAIDDNEELIEDELGMNWLSIDVHHCTFVKVIADEVERMLYDIIYTKCGISYRIDAANSYKHLCEMLDTLANIGIIMEGEKEVLIDEHLNGAWNNARNKMLKIRPDESIPEQIPFNAFNIMNLSINKLARLI